MAIIRNRKKPINKKQLTGMVLFSCAVLLSGCEHETPEEKVRQELAVLQETETAVAESGGTSDYVTSAAEETYTSPVDFAALQKQNEDICAWMEIPGTPISYPILKSEEDGEFYLDHDSLRGESVSGSLFLDDYNEADFLDPVTVVYGHHMKSGAYFGELQSYYADAESFQKLKQVKIYLPDEERVYEVFAAVPYNAIHLLYNYDFADPMQFYVFFDRVFAVRSFSANTDEKLYPEFEERVLILSTCLEGDNAQRYLVMAKEQGGR